MMNISDFMSGDHKRCDELYSEAEAGAAGGDWEMAREQLAAFVETMEHHFAMEEQVLFPDFEAASGHSGGPTQVMRYEHEQMRALFSAMHDATIAQDTEQFLGEAETLLILMQQHNRKEEQILYPMSDRLLAAAQPPVVERLQSLSA